MTDSAVQARGIGKRYRVVGPRPRYLTLREEFGRAIRSRSSARGIDESFWALRDVSFDITEGEVVGVIGRNGAGKSTLLKILSRVTEPTAGYARTRGRLASLLEVGTGMHPELTGRENVYLGGIILGMRRVEVDRRFDEIVAFAEVERFLDTALKHYSTGMYLRLAFAVAAHLEPEILIVDEVLAVGDAAFQQKCLGKMEEIGSSGRTVLFVSHNMPAVTRICERALRLEGGKLVEDGVAATVVASYLAAGRDGSAERVWDGDGPGGPNVRLRSVRVVDESGQASHAVDVRRAVGVRLEFDVLTNGQPLVPEIALVNESGTYLLDSLDIDASHRPLLRGRYSRTAWIPGNLLAEGLVTVHAGIITTSPQMRHAWVPDAVSFLVEDPMEGDSARGDFAGNLKGLVRPLLRWHAEDLE